MNRRITLNEKVASLNNKRNEENVDEAIKEVNEFIDKLKTITNKTPQYLQDLMTRIKDFYRNEFNHDILNTTTLSYVLEREGNSLSYNSFCLMDVLLCQLNKDVAHFYSLSPDIQKLSHIKNNLDYIAKSFGFIYSEENSGLIHIDPDNE